MLAIATFPMKAVSRVTASKLPKRKNATNPNPPNASATKLSRANTAMSSKQLVAAISAAILALASITSSKAETAILRHSNRNAWITRTRPFAQTAKLPSSAVNINDLFTEVLGDGADALLNLDKATKGEDYGSREKDEMEFSGDDDDDNDGDSDNDYESD